MGDIMKFTILGEPMASQSFKYTFTGKKYKPKKTKDYENNIRGQIINNLPTGFEPIRGAVEIKNIVYVFPILKNFPKWKINLIKSGVEVYKTTKPDLTDNLQKALIDAMKEILFTDDSIICKIGGMKKIYGFKPRIEIEIEEFTDYTDKSNWTTRK